MSFKWYAILMGLGTGLAWVAWVIILQTVNPDEAGILGKVFFFVTLFLGLVGMITLLGLIYRIGFRKRNEMLVKEVRVAFRHALLLSAVVVLTLIFSANDWLKWHTLVAFLLVVVGLEYMFLVFIDAQRR
jgi:Ca2+/Na+ antiporter